MTLWGLKCPSLVDAACLARPKSTVDDGGLVDPGGSCWAGSDPPLWLGLIINASFRVVSLGGDT